MGIELRPTFDRIVVRRIEAKKQTPGGIIIPEMGQEKPSEGLVVAAGEGKRLEDGTILPMTVAVGEHVLFSKYTGTEMTINEQRFVIMKEEDVLGKFILVEDKKTAESKDSESTAPEAATPADVEAEKAEEQAA